MPTRQITAVTDVTARALGVDLDPGAAAAEVQRNGVAPSSLDDFAAQLAEYAARGELAFLPRAAVTLPVLLEEHAFPLVAVARSDAGPFTAAVFTGIEGRNVVGMLVDEEGAPRPFAGSVAQALAAITPAESATDSTRVLVPVNVTPTVGVPQRTVGTPAEATDVGGLVGGEYAPGVAGGAGHDHGHGPHPFSRLVALLMRERRDILLVFGYAALAGLFSLALPLSVQQIVQLVSGRMLLQPTYILVGFVLLGTIGVGVLQLMQLSVVETIQQRVFARVALEFSFRVPRLRYDVALREDLPEVMNRFFETVTIQKALSKLLLDLGTALLTVFFGLVLLTLYHPYFTFFSAALVAALALLFWFTGTKGLETSINESKYKYKVVHWLEEMARANTAFKFAGRSSLPVERTDALVSRYLKYRKAHFGVLVQQITGLVAFRTFVVGTLLVLGIALVTNNQITLGQFVASEIVIVTVLAGVEKLIFSIEIIYDVLTSVDKLGHVTDLPLEASGGLVLQERRRRGMEVVVHDLAHRYAPTAAPALDGVSLTLRPGERVGITGYEGSGQTTLLRVLSGLVDTYDGGVSVDGVPLRDLDRSAYRGSVGQLLSATDLFDGTIEENVAVGRPGVGPHDVLAALREVGLAAWLREQPLGLRTPVSNGGRSLPSQVVARLLVAQGIVGHPRLVLVDDYYQNVEPDCRQELVHCLTDRAKPWTLAIVSHDPAFLAACDRVLVLADGRVAREGPFDRLADESAFVRRLVEGSAPRVRG